MKRMKMNVMILMVVMSVLACSHSTVDPIRLTPEVASTLKHIKVLNPGDEIIIYKFGRRPVSGKEVANYTPSFYFSVPSSKYLQKLTIGNLKSAFPGRKDFHQALDVHFKYDKDLVEFEKDSNQYKVISIFKGE